MKVSFAQIDEAYLRNKVETGYCSSVSEAIRDMVRKQREREQASLPAALEVGEQAVRNGQTFEYATALFEEAMSRGADAARRGDVVRNRDVRPQ